MAPGYRLVAWLLTAAMVALGAANVGIALWLNIWNRDFFNALEKRDLDLLFQLLWVLAAIVISAGVGVAVQLHVKRRLQINWRTWLSRTTVHRWLQSGRQYQLGLLADDIDNPDGRIAEDIRVSTELAVEFAQSILQCVLQLCTFLTVLWTLSGAMPIHLFGREFNIPGYMVWCAVAYALIGSLLTYALGRGLIDAGNVRQGREADFRSVLTRAREHAEGIALMRGEGDERERLRGSLFDLRTRLEPSDPRPGQPVAADQLARLSRADRAADRGPAALSQRADPARRADADRAGLLQRAVGAQLADRQFPQVRRMARLDQPRRAPARRAHRSRGEGRGEGRRADHGACGDRRRPASPARAGRGPARRRDAGGRRRGRDRPPRARADPWPVGQRQEHHHARRGRRLAVGPRRDPPAGRQDHLHAAEALFPSRHPARCDALSRGARGHYRRCPEGHAAQGRARSPA